MFAALPFAPNWAREYAPKIVRRQSDGKLFVRTKFTDVVGRPPLLVAGMTPTTTNTNLVAACSQAGYYCELAGGGYATESLWRSAVSNLVSKLSCVLFSFLSYFCGPKYLICEFLSCRESPKTSGNGVVANLLFLNQRLWSFQHSSLVKMREEEGLPIEGITIAAGVPSVERASELFAEYRRAGIKYVSFKPGSISAIKQVVEIASVNPETTVILQWTGGRGGGHHSFEDFHQPILATYSSIRRQKNIVLVAGSGFGDADGSWPYLTGEWSSRFGVALMPFDAILLGSRIMVAKEAATADSAKELLVSTEGLDPSKEKDWEKSYDNVVGGIATVRSELGEPIHKVATRGLLFWRDLDREIFSISPKDKQAAKIEEKKQWIINTLNSDFQKVYFGRRSDGKVVDLQDMTYAEVTY
jgi:fatty acid synthase subunit alpha, fungi type